MLVDIPKYKQDICGQWSKREKKQQLEISLKTAMFIPNQTTGYQGCQSDIMAFCTPEL